MKSPKEKIIVVSGKVGSVAFVPMALRQAGYKVVSIQDELEAYLFAETEDFRKTSLFFIDPLSLEGKKLLSRIQEKESPTPICMLPYHFLTRDKKKVYPATPFGLVDRVKRLCRKKRSNKGALFPRRDALPVAA